MIKSPAVGRKWGWEWFCEGRKLGREWEEKGYTKVSQVFISYNSSKVCAVQFQLVDPDGRLVLSPLHGRDDDATCFSTIHLDGQTEFVTGLSGYSGDSRRVSTSLLCLTITTNIRNYGPFGEQNPDSYHVTYDVQLGDNEAFGGFHGTSSKEHGLHSIGLFVKPRARLPLVSSSGQVKKEPH